MSPTAVDRPCDWVFCRGCQKWIPADTVFVLGTKDGAVRFSDPYCEQESESELRVGERPTTVPDTFASPEAGEGAGEES